MHARRQMRRPKIKIAPPAPERAVALFNGALVALVETPIRRFRRSPQASRFSAQEGPLTTRPSMLSRDSRLEHVAGPDVPTLPAGGSPLPPRSKESPARSVLHRARYWADEQKRDCSTRGFVL